MSEDIKQMYKKAGMEPPDGKGIHTKKFHRCVTSVAKDAKKNGKKIVTGDAEGEDEVNPYAVCMAQLGKKKAVKKSHRESKKWQTESVVDNYMISKGVYDSVSQLYRETQGSDFDTVLMDFPIEESDIIEIDNKKDFEKLALTLPEFNEVYDDSLDEYDTKIFKYKNWLLFVDTSGYDYPRYKALVKSSDLPEGFWSGEDQEEAVQKAAESLLEMDLDDLADEYDFEIDSAVIKALIAHRLEDAKKHNGAGREEAYRAAVEDLEEILMDEMVGEDEDLLSIAQDAVNMAKDLEEEPEEEEGDEDEDDDEEDEEEPEESVESAVDRVVSEQMEIYEPSKKDRQKAISALKDTLDVSGKPTNTEFLTVRKGKSNKYLYFAMFKKNGKYVAGSAYGRIGYTPKASKIAEGDKEEVKAAMNKKISTKKKKGYK